MVSMARPFLADSELMEKARQGREDEINTCIGCNQACLDHTFFGKRASCLVNPRAGHETTLQYLPTTSTNYILLFSNCIKTMHRSIKNSRRWCRASGFSMFHDSCSTWS